MCAQFILKANLEFVLRRAGLPRTPSSPADFEFDLLVVPYQPPTPVLIAEGLQMMTFSLVPHWAKERKVKFATHNARLFSEDGKVPIFEKPTWREPFQKRHCAVPLTQFIEPIYTGEFANHMVRFGVANQPEQVLLAAAIWDRWVDRSTGEIVESFAIITNDPPQFILDTGHDRCPIFLNDEAVPEWLDPAPKGPEHWVDFLVRETKSVDFAASSHRVMKSKARTTKKSAAEKTDSEMHKQTD